MTPRSAVRRPLLLSTLLAALVGGACQSPEALTEDADRDALDLLEASRGELFGQGGPFEVSRPEDTLRARLLAGEPAPAEPLDLGDLLEIAAENSREYQTQRESLYRAALDLAIEQWRLSWIPSGDGDLRANGTGNDSGSASAGIGAGLSRLLGTGATIVSNIGASMLRVIQTGDSWSLTSDLSLAITQPLLQGSGRRIALEPLTQAERSLVYQVRDFERFKREYAVDVANRLFGLLEQLARLKNQESNYANLVALRERNDAVAAAGRLSQIEADQAQQNEVRSESQLVSQRAAVQRAKDQLNLFLGLPIETDLEFDRSLFESIDLDEGAIASIDVPSAIDVALEQRLDFATTNDRLADAERKAWIARDALRVGLDLSASLGSQSANDRPLQYDWRTTSWSVGLGLDMPWGRLPQAQSYRRSLITVDVQKRAVEAASDGLVASVRDAVRVLENARRNLELQEIAVAIAQRRVESTRLNLDYGQASTRDVLEAEEALREARNSRASSVVDLLLARYDFYLELETLRVGGEGITIDEDLIARVRAEAD